MPRYGWSIATTLYYEYHTKVHKKGGEVVETPPLRLTLYSRYFLAEYSTMAGVMHSVNLSSKAFILLHLTTRSFPLLP